MIRIQFSLFLLAASTLIAADPGADGKLFQAVRDNQVGAIKPLLAAGANINARGELGGSPLMWAAAISSREMLVALLKSGADVNFASDNGSTALLWAVRDAGKVRLLLEHGAEVNITNKDGITPILAAASAPGGAEVIRLLVAKGAIVKGSSQARLNPLVSAYRTRDSELIQALATAGLELKKKEDFGDKPLSVLQSGVSTEHLRKLLSLGADPNEMARTLTLTFPMLGALAAGNRLDAVQLLLSKGANPNLQGNKGYSALMMATSPTPPNPELIRVLLEAGADVNLKDAKGLTALDWALKQGETEVAAILRKAGAKAGVSLSPPKPVAEPRTIAAAIAQAAPLLAKTGPESASKLTCLNCHANSLPAVALQAVQRRGIPVRDELAGHYAAAFAKWKSPFFEAALWNEARNTYMEWSLAEVGYPSGLLTSAIALRTIRTQREDGRWGGDGDSIRPPLSASPVKVAAFSIRVLDVYTPAHSREAAQKAIARADVYLKSVKARDTQDAAFQILGLKWGGASEADIAPFVQRLLSLQRQDGGWGQMPTMPADAYATGQGLYALHVAGQVAPSASAYERGVKYLLLTQLEDGSWYVPTRAFGFQPYYESGFPHGVDQYISSSASSWSVMALAVAAEPAPASEQARR